MCFYELCVLCHTATWTAIPCFTFWLGTYLFNGINSQVMQRTYSTPSRKFARPYIYKCRISSWAKWRKGSQIGLSATAWKRGLARPPVFNDQRSTSNLYLSLKPKHPPNSSANWGLKHMFRGRRDDDNSHCPQHCFSRRARSQFRAQTIPPSSAQHFTPLHVSSDSRLPTLSRADALTVHNTTSTTCSRRPHVIHNQYRIPHTGSTESHCGAIAAYEASGCI